MTAALDNLILGFGVALSGQNILFCLIGSLIGTLIGVLPGLGPLATLAMLLPLTFTLEPVSALIMLAGIYYGAQYGGSTTAILVNMPGESSSVVTCIDGHQMAKQGRAGVALSVAALGSFFAGCVGTLVIAFFAPALTRLGQQFGPAEYTSLMVLGLIAAVVLASGSILKAIAMVLLGLLLGLVGTDVSSAASRFTFGIPELMSGIGFVPLTMGMFGVSEIIANLTRKESGPPKIENVTLIWPSRADFRRAAPASVRGTMLGTILGVLPGGGAILASFASYSLEKWISKVPKEFGHGAIEGVAGPESANNAGAQTSFIPLLTLGIPSNAVMALMMGAMMIHGIAPGPQVMTTNPTLFWGMVASMFIGNAMLVIINLPMIGLWVRLLRIPYQLLFPAILLFCCIGAYSVNNSMLDVLLTAIFGFSGYILSRLGCEPVSLLLGFVLGPLMEEYFRRAMLLSHGDPIIFLQRPISLMLLVMSALLLLVTIVPVVRRQREEAFVE